MSNALIGVEEEALWLDETDPASWRARGRWTVAAGRGRIARGGRGELPDPLDYGMAPIARAAMPESGLAGAERIDEGASSGSGRGAPHLLLALTPFSSKRARRFRP